jgi:uncharacterized protein YdhG (YjbR/CyaY superfamily)
MTITVDDYVNSQVPPEHRDTVVMLRAVVRGCAPQAEEAVSYGMPVFKVGGKIFAWIIATKKDITFSFRAGISFEDNYRLLRGTGKHARHVKIKSVESIDEGVLRYYIKQALILDAT